MAGVPAADRLGRLSTLYRFVAELSEAHPCPDAPRDAVDVLLARLGERHGPAVLLGALLLALGERAELECAREMAFVRVAVRPEELHRLPPHADPVRQRDRLCLFLDPRRAKTPFGFLPASVRDAVAARHRAGPAPRRLAPAGSGRERMTA